jgi:death-on-curing protein
MSTPRFLALDEVLAIHESRIRLYGGASGLRDLALLDSALANVSATFDRQFLHATLFEMAAAYLYGICRNHPFLDGNKRTGLACALVFLALNGIQIEAGEDELVELVVGIADGSVSKAATTVFLEEHVAR